jgi:flavin reductase (DIM6/NTAB) family NADH-FMN oxidoreductase RutF
VLQDTKDLGSSVVVIGRVVLLSVIADAIVDGYPAIERLRPLARLGRRQWATIGEVKEIGRIRFEDWERGSR